MKKRVLRKPGSVAAHAPLSEWIEVEIQASATKNEITAPLEVRIGTCVVSVSPGFDKPLESYMWLYRTSGCACNPIVLYEYQSTRSSAHPKAFLKEFQGYLHTDGYTGYHALPPEVKIVGC